MAITPIRTDNAAIGAGLGDIGSLGIGGQSGGIQPVSNPGSNVNLAYMDPTYLAFLREMGVQDSEASAEAGSRIARLNGRVEDMKPMYEDRMRLGLRDIGENAEDRGMFRSGRRLDDQTQFQVETNREHQGAINDIRDQQADIGTSLARQIAGNRRQRAEMEMSSQDRMARENAQYGIG